MPAGGRRPILSTNRRAGTDPGNPSTWRRRRQPRLPHLHFRQHWAPKGVMVSHRSLLALPSAWEPPIALRCPPLRHLQAAGFSFDVFTGDWVRALPLAARSSLAPARLARPGGAGRSHPSERIECLELVPAVADALATHLERQAEDLDGIRLWPWAQTPCEGVCTGGSAGSWTRRPRGQLLRSDRGDDRQHVFRRLADDLDGDGPVPIGRPFPGTRAYVLDGVRASPRRCGRRTVHRRVWCRSRLRAAVRARRQNDSCPTLTVCRDHGCTRRETVRVGASTGVLALMGRQDGQVKVRGFRVELAEVEAALARHPEVAANSRRDHCRLTGEKRLAAYVVPTTACRPSGTELRRWLKERMPEPMVPSWYVFLNTLPLSRNGKVDRSALPPPGDASTLTARRPMYVPPRTTAEEILAGITADLLGPEPRRHPRQLLRASASTRSSASRSCREHGKRDWPSNPAHLFRHPNIAELAAAAVSTSIDHEFERDIQYPRSLRSSWLPMASISRLCHAPSRSTGASRIFIPSRRCRKGCSSIRSPTPRRDTTSSSSSAVFEASSTSPALEESWHRLVARHPALRSTIHWTDFDRPYQVVHRRADHPLDYQDWRGLSPSEQDERLDGLSRFGPPTRFRSLSASLVATGLHPARRRLSTNSSGASIMS